MTEKTKSKTKWLWRWLRWGLIGAAVLATVIAILITEEDWRGKRDWENYQQLAAVQGEHFDEITFNTNEIPDDQNFARAPIFSDLANLKWNPKSYEWEPRATNGGVWNTSIYWSNGTTPQGGTGDFNRARLIDLQAWQTYYRNPPRHPRGEFPIAPNPQSPAADVLLALSKYDQPIEALRTASRRPKSRFGSYGWGDTKSMGALMAYVADMKQWFQVVELRTLAELADGQTTKALEDVKLLSRLNDKMRQEPLLISQLVSLALMNLVLQPVYEGLARHQWSDAQLAELEQLLADKDFLADYQTAIRGERAFAIDTLESMRLNREYKIEEDSSGTNQETTINYQLMPSAFFYQNELNFAKLDDQFLSLVDLQKRIIPPAAQHKISSDLSKALKYHNPYRIESLMTVPAYTKTVTKFAVVQTQNDLARVACALERYRLAQGSYPDSLDILAPQYIEKIPLDVINGQPLHYHRTANGSFVLYSVGWNETDDGGQIVFNKAGSIDREKGDWVWQYSAQ